ncbi:general secretion pathway protein L [Burkholderia sp. lig30]|jgi:general secretion pathway protein L|uniref:type II secretion system protein GspL n=1 Tax=Burkholderia sp. lig30 TaxID=1192124 RepID=UPI0004610277|nr:type II secretion system protein GspL [Burkholderia sp. lig30]KDB10723.1 general secretion pathway protein L [Burkholderia sp. lig30]
MSSLIVLLPPLDTFDAQTWQTMPMPYACFDRHARLERAGDAPPDAWPKAAATVLVLAARDTLLIDVPLPPVTGMKLRRILPHAVEEYLIDDAQRCHVAVAPAAKGDAQRRVAVVERERFGALLDAFVAAGHRRLRVVPLLHCMPAGELTIAAPMPAARADDAVIDSADETAAAVAETDDTAAGEGIESGLPDEADVLIVRRATLRIEANDADNATDNVADSNADSDDDAQWLDVAVKQGTAGFGFETHASALDVAIAELSRLQPIRVHALAVTAHGDADEPQDVPATADVRAPAFARAGAARPNAFPLAARTLPWETLAHGALACPFDLCQFEFASGARATGVSNGWRPWRFALGFAIASLAVSTATVNVQWYRLRHREDALNARMTDVMKTAFPGTTAVLDPHAQMQAGLERLRGAAGELRANDYLVLASALARALAPIPSDAVAMLDYRDGSLDVTFRPGTTLDADGFRRRLQAQGLTVQEDNAKWTIGSARPAPR